jgi:hypothetical protein
MRHQPKLCRGPLSRRSFLEVGGFGMAGIGLADLLRLRAEAAPTLASPPDTSVILVWLPGGAPQMETYDMKPDAPAEYRGDFKPIHTNVPGIDVCELLPLHAKIADRFTLIRSIHHDFEQHDGGHKRVLTGRIPKSPRGFVNDAPMAGSIVAKCRENVNRGVPNYVSVVDDGRHLPDVFSFGAAYLGPSYTPFVVPGDPSKPGFSIPNLNVSQALAARLDDRRALLQGLDRLRRDMDASGSMVAMDRYNQTAFNLLTSSAVHAAFDLSKEDSQTRERYGNHAWGQRSLLARRLVEAGSSFVTVVMENPTPGKVLPEGTLYNWDSHAINCNIVIDTRFRAPYYDQAVTALVEDIYNRGLDKKVMLVVMGEFGRTPKLESEIGIASKVRQPGRGHWPPAMSVLMCGGGMRTGQIVGSTNSKGETPKERPLTPNDLWATVYRHLGIDYNQAFLDHTGRPMPILPFGEPIRELI